VIRYTACPLCESHELDDLDPVDITKHPAWREGLPHTITWRECLTCSHIFTAHHWSTAELDLITATVLESQRPGHEVEAKRHTWGRVVERIAARKPVGTWLDVGFGDGTLMMTAREFGYTVCGIDLRADAVTAMRSIGFDARQMQLHEVDGLFDIVSMFDVLEHTGYPLVTLGHAARLLKRGGLLCVSLPNMACAPWQEADANGTNPYWAELEHHHNFTRERLYLLLAEAGFAAVHYAVSDRWRFGMDVIARKEV
jgi:SAM-dependent methyltransferase